jgi:hypothetical protein
LGGDIAWREKCLVELHVVLRENREKRFVKYTN